MGAVHVSKAGPNDDSQPTCKYFLLPPLVVFYVGACPVDRNSRGRARNGPSVSLAMQGNCKAVYGITLAVNAFLYLQSRQTPKKKEKIDMGSHLRMQHIHRPPDIHGYTRGVSPSSPLPQHTLPLRFVRGIARLARPNRPTRLNAGPRVGRSARVSRHRRRSAVRRNRRRRRRRCGRRGLTHLQRGNGGE